MIKKQQKWIALFVALTFIWLMQVSTMPAFAAGTSEQVAAAGAEPGPRFIEEEGDSGYKAKGKSILPIILIGVGVVAVAAVLFLVVLKGYDITGSWSGTLTINGMSSTFEGSAVFSGTKKSGTVLFTDPGVTNAPGTYTVDGKNVAFSITNEGNIIEFTGTFTDKDKMSGTWKNLAASGWGGNWEMTRAGAAAQQPLIKSPAGGKSVLANK